jgi:riboflavin synthase
VAGIAADGFARRVLVELPEGLERYVVEHGSIALDGVSLTVAAIDGRIVEVSLIPETLERTTFGAIEAGDPVNVEVDVIARQAERLLKGFEVSNGK